MYVYEAEKAELFTDEGQRTFLAIRDHTQVLLSQAGAVRMQEAISKSSGSSWQLMACVDRMVELGEIVEVEQGRQPPGQYRIFRSTK